MVVISSALLEGKYKRQITLFSTNTYDMAEEVTHCN